MYSIWLIPLCVRLYAPLWVHALPVFDSDKVTEVERFIYVAPVILYTLAELQAVSINN